ncbi:hypothetical protein [Bradyrhizobium sp. S3.2.12]|uniref:hypothetical protein n=1 Tax=Bradyrhizobium sp. S3.2.12 TaxID=3156387 RepID=UPI003393A4DD
MTSNIVPMQPYPGHPLRSLKQLAAKADQLVRRYNEVNDLGTEAFTERVNDLTAAKAAATLNETDDALLAQCESALQRFDPASNYEDDGQGNLKRSVIGQRVAMLVGAFPNAAPGDPAVFVRMLIEALSSVEYLSLPALDTAIWRIVETKKFIPAISEVLDIVHKQRSDWGKRFLAIREIAEASSWALTEIEALQVEAVGRNTGKLPP